MSLCVFPLILVSVVIVYLDKLLSILRCMCSDSNEIIRHWLVLVYIQTSQIHFTLWTIFEIYFRTEILNEHNSSRSFQLLRPK